MLSPDVLHASVLEAVGFPLVQPLLLTLHCSKHLGGWGTENFRKQQDPLAQYLAALK